MTDSERNRKWRERYNREVNNMTLRYEKMNKQAEVITRQATAEENEYYTNLINEKRGIR